MTEIKLNSKHWTIIGAAMLGVFLHMKGVKSYQELVSVQSVGEMGCQVVMAILGLVARSVNKAVQEPLVIPPPESDA